MKAIYLGATIILSSLLAAFGPPRWAESFPSDSDSAWANTVYGVFTHGLPSNRLCVASCSAREISLATSVTPYGIPSNDMALGSGELLPLNEIGDTVGQLASIKATSICSASAKHSESSAKYQTVISPSLGGSTSAISSANFCLLSWRGPRSFRSCSVLSCASAVCFFNASASTADSILYVSNSALVRAFSSRWPITTAAVVTTTANAASAAAPRAYNISCSQECNASPNTRLTRLGYAVIIVSLFSAIGIIVTMFWVFARGRR